jgi:ABC-2 type transport system permease protein
VAWLLVQLKLRQLTNALRASGRAKASFVVSTFFAGLVAVGTFALLALLRGGVAPVDQTAAVFTVFAFGWVILPLLTFGLDGTLDPATLALYPLRTRSLAVGLLAASATGAWPLANLIGELGAVAGLARGALGILVGLIAVILQVLFCITLARFVTTALAGLLRSRRGKDLVAFLVIPIFALYETFAQVVPRLAAEGKITAQTFAGIDRWLRWLPPGLAAHAIQDASDGHPGAAFLRLGLLAVIIAGLLAAWIRSLSGSLVKVDTSTQSSAVRGAPLPFARSGIRGAVAGRYLLYQRREPASIVRWCVLGVVMLAASVSTIRTPHYHVALILSAILAGGMLSIFHANTIGVTGPGFCVEAMALTGVAAMRAYFAGRVIALALIAIPLTAVLSVALAAIAGHPGAASLALPIDFAAVGIGLGLGSIFTVTLAYPTQKRVGSPIPGPAPGHGGQSFAASMASLFGVALLCVPVIIAADHTYSVSAAVRAPVVLLIAAAYGLAAAWAGVQIAARAAAGRLPELVQIAFSSDL